MRRLQTAILCALLLTGATGAAGAAGAEAGERHVRVEIDLSRSALISSSDAFAEAAAVWIRDNLGPLESGSEVVVETFGAYGFEQNSTREVLRVTRRRNGHRVAGTAASIVASIPQLVREGTLAAADSTNLIGQLEDLAPVLRCDARPVHVVVVTDALEASPAVDPRRLAAGQARLPAPRPGLMDGCDVTLLGLGQMRAGTSRAVSNTLEAAWRQWMEAAGVRRFVPLRKF